MNIGGVNFPSSLLNGLRDGRLVIFAGAGVSMGVPANFPSFAALASQIADGTGQVIGESETEDLFLGRLEDAGIDVHQRAADILQMNGPEPTELHHNLLRLSDTHESVRIVTTNFDLLFEKAAEHLFNTAPEIFRAPALPYGQRFEGIVHIHGAVSKPYDMVLTNKDFGRGYLTESDGWARRFLVDVFASHTVLFMGYSHNDTIMTYLTPSLPRDSAGQRYALIGSQSDEPGRWRNLGIEPIVFSQESETDYASLDLAISGLANYMRRGILDWQQQITRIASGPPPLEEESAGVIEYSLTDPVYTRFFAEAAESPEWITWLDNRNYLDALFSYGDLNDQQMILSAWLCRFAIKEPSVLFRVVERHGSNLNPHLWNMIAWQMGKTDVPLPAPQILSRWVHLLMSTIPIHFNDALLEGIAENCATQGLMVNLLQIYDTMTASRGQSNPRVDRNNSDLYNYQIQTLWQNCLEPNLPEIADSLLERTVWRLEERHSLIRAWDEEYALDSDSFSRSAIEPHEQDRYPKGIDALINISRDSLEWLALNRPDAVRSWCERYSRSPAPLLRRLAVHVLPARIDLSPNEKIDWLLERYDVNELPAKHEIFRAVALIYPEGSTQQKGSVIDSVLAFHWPGEDGPDRDRLTAHHNFDWLQWLNEASHDCPLVKQALEAIQSRYPEFLQREHPDMTVWTETWSRLHSPWTVEELLAKTAREWLTALLEYQPTHPFDRVNREGLLTAITEAAQKNVAWGLELATEMEGMGHWDADLWRCLLRAWSAAELVQNDIGRVLAHLSLDELYKDHARELIDTLYEIIKKVTEPPTSELLAEANAIARKLHDYATRVDPPQMTRYLGGVEEEVDWLTKAINHPLGILASFWLQSFSLWRQQQKLPSAKLGDEFQDVLAKIMANQDPPGKLARVVFASRISFLTSADEEWTKQNLIPLLQPNHEEFESAWDGVTYSPSFTPRAAELLRDLFLQAVEYIDERMVSNTRSRFVASYTSMLIWFVSSPTDQWITKLLAGNDQDVRHQFSREIERNLRFLDELTQKRWWSTWLKGYWENRLAGIPASLDPEEIETMIEWTTSLPAVYPDAVELAIKMPTVPMRRGTLIYRLSDSDIPDEHPESLAKLLIRLGETDDPSFMWHRAKSIIDQLLQTPLNEHLEKGLKEIIAKFGL